MATRSIITILLFALLIACLAGCEKDEGINGTYTYEQHTPDGGHGGVSLVLSGRDRAVFKIHPPNADPLPDTEGIYVVDGNKLSVTINNGTSVYTIVNDHRIEGEFLGTRIVLLKRSGE